METIFMNTKNSKTSESNRFRLDFTDKLDLRGNKTIVNLSIYYTWQNLKSEYKNKKFKIIRPTWDSILDLPNGSYTIADIQDYFLYIIKEHESITSNAESPVLIYPNRIKNRIVFKIKTGYKLELLTNETMALLGDGPIIDTNKNGDNVPELEQVHSVLIHCNAVHNDYLQDSKLLHFFVPDKSFGQLISIQPKELIQSKATGSIFNYVEIWFIDQNNRPLQIEGSVNIALIIQTRDFFNKL